MEYIKSLYQRIKAMRTASKKDIAYFIIVFLALLLAASVYNTVMASEAYVFMGIDNEINATHCFKSEKYKEIGVGGIGVVFKPKDMAFMPDEIRTQYTHNSCAIGNDANHSDNVGVRAYWYPFSK